MLTNGVTYSETNLLKTQAQYVFLSRDLKGVILTLYFLYALSRFKMMGFMFIDTVNILFCRKRL